MKDGQRKYWSCVAAGKAKVRYFVGKKIVPPSVLSRKGYGLLVFARLQDAINFNPDMYGFEKYICEVDVGTPKPLRARCIMYELKLGHLKISSRSEWPDGTLMVPWVKLPNKTN